MYIEKIGLKFNGINIYYKKLNKTQQNKVKKGRRNKIIRTEIN